MYEEHFLLSVERQSLEVTNIYLLFKFFTKSVFRFSIGSDISLIFLDAHLCAAIPLYSFLFSKHGFSSVLSFVVSSLVSFAFFSFH